MADGSRRKKKYEWFNKGQGLDLSVVSETPPPVERPHHEHTSPPPLTQLTLSPGPSYIDPTRSFHGMHHSPFPVPRMPPFYPVLPEPVDHSGRYSMVCPPRDTLHRQEIEVQHDYAQSYGMPTPNKSKKRTQNCQKCRNHDKRIPIKDHKWHCEYRDCVCEKCQLTKSKQESTKQQKKQNKQSYDPQMMGRSSPSQCDNGEIEFPQLGEMEEEIKDIPNLALCQKIDQACKNARF